MITNDDVNTLKTTFATKEDVQDIVEASKIEILDKIDDKLVNFRSDIINKLDQVIGELKSNHEDRLEAIESKLNLSS